jgi:hypothetical protein
MFFTFAAAKLVNYVLMLGGLALAVWLFSQGGAGIVEGLVVIFALIPFVLWLGSVVLGLVGYLFIILPVALLTGRRGQLAEFVDFQGAVMADVGSNARPPLRVLWQIVKAYEMLPRWERGDQRSGYILLGEYENMVAERDADHD